MAYVNLAKGLGAARGRNHVLPGMNLYPRRPWRRGVAGFGRRGFGSLSFPQVMVTVPQPGGLTTQEPTAETELANAAAQLANSPTTTAIDYPSQAAIAANLLQYAQTLCNYSWSPYTCVGFDPVAMAQKYTAIVWNALQSNISPVSGQPNYNPAPGAQPPPSTPPVYQAPFNPAKVPGASALPPPPASFTPPVQSPVQSSPVPMPPTPQPVASPPPTVYIPPAAPPPAASGNGSAVASFPSISFVDSAGNPNWPLIAGAGALLLGGLYVLGGSR